MASQGGNRYGKVCVVKCHHIHKHIWTPAIVEKLVLEAQDGNEHNNHATVVIKYGYIVRHIPHSISRVPCIFLMYTPLE